MLVRTLEFCEPCGAFLTIYRERYGLQGVLAALSEIAEQCPLCALQLRGDESLSRDGKVHPPS